MDLQKIISLDKMLKELADVVYNKLKMDSIEDIDKSIMIVSSRNFNHISSIRIKMKNLSMFLYSSGALHDCAVAEIKNINKIMDEICALLES